MMSVFDEFWMRLALMQAQFAEEKGEVPVGAVLVKDNEVVAHGFNESILSNDPTAHAEVVTIRKAGQALANYRLPGTTLYVTLEPCLMCAGALVHARIKRLVFGAFDPKAGVVTSQVSLLDSQILNHKIAVSGGVLEKICAKKLKAFFKNKRR